jgi:hypothetical protein
MSATYIRFPDDHGPVLVEVDESETGGDGMIRAGLADKLQDSLAAAQSSLEFALGHIIRTNGRALVAAVADLEPRPAQTELTFGIKATGELGN